MHRFVPPTLAVSILLPVLAAQAPTYLWSPQGADKYVGGSNNTIPFWGQSASYQQIHDADDFGSKPVAMKGMAFRPAGARTLTGRSWDLRLTLSHTKVAANAMSTTFSTNLAGANTMVVFGTTTTFNKFSWPTSTSTGTGVQPPTFTIPFANSYLYLPTLGNLCWEWRHLNATVTSSMPMDATSGSAQRGTVLSKVGKGCFVGSSTSPATATITNNTIGTAGYMFQATLTNATASQSAIMAMGVTPKSQNIGWCTNVELVPAILLYGKTDGAGSWAFQAPIKAAAGASAVTIYLQYVYNDAGQAAGLGLSDMAGYTTPNIAGASGVSRMWNSPAFNTTNGYETATTGTTGLRYGLLVGWLQ